MAKKQPHHSEFDFSQITEHIFVGTNLCCDDESHLKLLNNMNVSTEIDLEEERQAPAPKVNVYLWLPVKDKTAPTQMQLDSGVTLVNQSIINNQNVFVHCRLGHGRSPTLVAAYFIFKGQSIKNAIQKIRDARPEIHIEAAQMAALEKYYQKINSL